LGILRNNYLGVLVEEPAASEELEAITPEFTAVENGAEEVAAEDEGAAEEAGAEEAGANDDDEAAPDKGEDEVSADDVDEAASADTNVAPPDEAGAEDVATAEVVFKREV